MVDPRSVGPQIEHYPWQGSKYRDGVSGQRLAIVGHTHYYEQGKKDHDNMTRDTIGGVINGDRKHFFTTIAGWFFSSPEVFFERVVFFNYIPESIGTEGDRHKKGTSEQYERGERRFLRLLEEFEVEKVIVCSAALQERLPQPLEVKAEDYGKLRTKEEWGWCTYTVNERIVMTFFLQHPQSGPPQDLMRRVIEEILGATPPAR